MKTFELSEFTPKAEFELLQSIYDEYRKDPWAICALVIKTPRGTFINKGGFNGNPGDLWLVKRGTVGHTKKTFWRTCIGSKRSGFRVFVYDLRSVEVTPRNIDAVAKEIGCNVTGPDGMGLRYFVNK